MTPRQLATNLGVPTYNTGKPCKNGHTTDRYTSGGMCIGCLKAHQEKVKAARRDVTTQKVQGAMPLYALAKPKFQPLLSQFTTILRYADAKTIEELQAYITMLEGNIAP